MPYAITIVVLFCLGLASCASALDMRELIRQVETQYRGSSAQARVSMEVATDNWRRTLEMESWSLGREHFLTRILEPPKEKGVATLKVRKEVWNYLPKVDRVIKIPPSMMGGAWMGSHITNDDLVKGSQVDEDYTFALLEETATSWRIECLPKPEAAVVWGKLVYEIEKTRKLPVRIDYYDEAQKPVREIIFDEVREIGGRTLPARMTVRPLDKPAERTVMRYHDIAFDLALGEDFFSLRTLKAR
ncbi:outer membrane lipoprotein-sorting protein [Trichloromonas sp.]|uniref:outer membrane lipoprotein-sorting protein n=1 Tax=Trichloromonas sp. TaxID=3069249 RepID=UPI002A3B03F2|nr:outer membrane lipoprotein-sorting protein [Trichloromonas sp.]